MLAHVPSFGRNPRGSPDFLAYPVPKACMHVLGTWVPRRLGVARSASSPKAALALECSLTPGLRVSFGRVTLRCPSWSCARRQRQVRRFEPLHRTGLRRAPPAGGNSLPRQFVSPDLSGNFVSPRIFFWTICVTRVAALPGTFFTWPRQGRGILLVAWGRGPNTTQ